MLCSSLLARLQYAGCRSALLTLLAVSIHGFAHRSKLLVAALEDAVHAMDGRRERSSLCGRAADVSAVLERQASGSVAHDR